MKTKKAKNTKHRDGLACARSSTVTPACAKPKGPWREIGKRLVIEMGYSNHGKYMLSIAVPKPELDIWAEIANQNSLDRRLLV